MSQDPSQFVRRMYDALVEEIRAQRPELLDESFTVAEIYQSLVPYRTHRDRIGTEMNGDYEDALVRLLSGEGGYLKLESEAARRRLREELESVRPDTGIYRDFAACEVRLSAGEMSVEAMGTEDDGSVHDAGAGVGGDGAGEAFESVAENPEATAGNESEDWLGEVAAETEGGEAEEATTPPDAELPAVGMESSTPTEESEEVPTCHWCRERLPIRDDLRFCPFCGSRVDRIPCPECGTELEEGWLFCVACGAEIGD